MASGRMDPRGKYKGPEKVLIFTSAPKNHKNNKIFFWFLFLLFTLSFMYISFSLLLNISEKSYERAEELFLSGNYRRAAFMLEELYSGLRPGCAQKTLMGRSFYQAARKEYIKNDWKGYGADPDDYMNHPFAEKALLYLSDAYENCEGKKEKLLSLKAAASLMFEKGWYKKAAPVYYRVYRISGNPSDLTNAAICQYKSGLIKESEKTLLLALEKGDPAAAKNLAYIYTIEQTVLGSTLEKSREYLHYYIEKKPQDPEIFFIKYLILSRG
ncbi:MAG: hypothetical protein ACLFQK_01440 [Fibrobacterota bacterium]